MRGHYHLSLTNSELTGGADFNKLLTMIRPTSGATNGFNLAASSIETSYGFTELGDPGPRGNAGFVEYTIKLGVGSGEPNVFFSTRVHRISSTGSVIASSAQTAAQEISADNTVYTFGVAADLGDFSETDRIRVDYIFDNQNGSIVSITMSFGISLDTEFVTPWSKPLLRRSARLALSKSNYEAAWIVDMELPGGTYRGSITGKDMFPATGAAGNLSYPPLITSMSPIPFGVALRESGLQSPEVTAEWADPDGDLTRIITGPDGKDVVGSAVTIRYAIKGVPEAEWPTRFTGIVTGRQFRAFEQSWSFRYGPDDRVLFDGLVPRLYVSQADFPNAPAASLKFGIPQLFGIWDSVGVTNTGACPTIPVGQVVTAGNQYCYLVCHAWANSVVRAYKDGLGLNVGDWTEHKLVINGKNYTLVGFDDEQLDAEITVDVEGLNVGSTVIEAPLTILQLWLLNFVVGDYQGGPHGTGAPLVLSPETLSFMVLDYEGPTQFDFRGALRVEKPRKPSAIIDELTESWNYRTYWHTDGTIRFKPIDHRPILTYIDWPWVNGYEDELGSLDVPYEDRDKIDRVLISYLQDGVTDDLVRTLEVREPGLEENTSDTVEMRWGPARIV